MPIASTFYDTLPGEGVKETTWAQSAMSRGPLFGVVGADDLRLTAHATLPYTLNIGPGKAWGHGVWDDVTGTTQVTSVAPPNNGTRWDLVALRRDWQPTGGGPSSFRVIQGSTAAVIPTNRENRPGIVADQPLYLVQWQGGQNQPRQIIDLRCWSGPGGVEIAHVLARSYLQFPGAAIKLGNDVQRFERQENGVWGWGNGNSAPVDMELGITPGVANVRHQGWFSRIGGTTCTARLIYGGQAVHIQGELIYVNPNSPTYEPGEGAQVAILPPNMRPAYSTYVLGTTAQYRSTQLYTVNPDGNIALGPFPSGKVAQFNGVFPL